MSFGPWIRWNERKEVPAIKLSGGVYLLAYFNPAPPPISPHPDRLPHEVIYVGDAKNLNRRPLRGKHHRIGPRFLKLFGEAAETSL